MNWLKDKCFQRGWLAALLLVAATFIAYLPVWHAGFIWDDDSNVTGNLPLRSLAGLRQIWFEPGATQQYYPLTYTSFWVEYHLWGLNPLGYHAANVLLHALNALLVWLLLRRLSVPGAWLAAALFALHPVGVESVAWVTERKNTLSGFLYLASALACLRFWLPAAVAGSCAGSCAQTAAARRGPWRFYWLGLVLYLCALGSKTATVPLPVVLLLVMWWKRRRIGWRELYLVLPFLMIGVAMGLVTIWAENHGVGPWTQGEVTGDGAMFDWRPGAVVLSWQARLAPPVDLHLSALGD